MKQLFYFVMMVFVVHSVYAQNARDMSEAEQLGTVAGLASACDAQKLNDYELIASRILANKASTDEAELVATREYAAAKYTAFRRHQHSPQMTCSDIISHFNELPIFNSVVYADGTVKMFDGSWLRPKRPLKKELSKKNASKPAQPSVRSR